MHPCVSRRATFHLRRYFVLLCNTSFLISVFSISTLPFSPWKISFLFDVFLLDQETAKHPCKVFFYVSLLDQNTAVFHNCKISILIYDYNLWCQSLSQDVAEPSRLWDVVCNCNCYVFVFIFLLFFCINLENYYLTRPNLCKLGEVVEKGEQNDGKNVHPTTKQLEMIWSFLFCNQDHPL